METVIPGPRWTGVSARAEPFFSEQCLELALMFHVVAGIAPGGVEQMKCCNKNLAK